MGRVEVRRREIDDLAGGEVKRKRGRPRKVQVERTPEPAEPEDDDAEAPDLSYKSVYAIRQGVPVRWLSLVFGHTEHVVKRRLKDVRPVDVGAHGNPLYTVVEAAPYLVEPKMDLKEFLLSIRDEDLPDDLRLKFWSARRQRNKTLLEEGELWWRAEVVAKFGEILLALREKLQLAPEIIERQTGVTPDQYKLLRGIIDSVQDDMHKTILELAAKDQTLSVLGGSEEDEVVL